MPKLLLLVLTIVAYLPANAFAWNDKGHMVVAQLAYQRLSAEQRQSVLAVLKQHPHWDEFLIADRPDNVPEEQWAFWRAATWADWIKHHHQQLNEPKWHYVNYPLVPASSSEQMANHQPQEQNIVTELAACIEKTRGASGQEKAINLCWVMHLIGDIHQPLHCATLFCEQFPKGDKGGNDSLYRLGARRIIKLHSFWDDLLGRSVSHSSVVKGAEEAEQAVNANRGEVTREEQANPSIESWARESYALAVAYAYVDGKVIPAVADRRREPEEVPEVPEAYAENAGLIARVSIGKAGERLAGVLGQILR